MANGFIDKARITVRAGNGGNGAVAFHREKYIAAGGPDGGDGGSGGSIILKVDDNMSTLMDFRYKRKYVAGNGVDGQGGRKTGKDGESLTIKVPRGTLVRDAESGEIIKDMSDDKPYVLCRGGRGGWGNQHFATPTRQVPRFAKAGLPGESHDVILELKLLADVTGTTVMINNPFIFDLNGHSVDALSVDAKATIKDSGTTKGRIGKVTVFNEKVTDLTLGSLLEEGYAFKYGNGYWANDSYLQTTEGSFVTVEKAPIQSVNVYAKDKNNQEILTIAYGATGEVTLVSSCKLSETSGENLSCAWYKLTDDTAIPPLEGAAGTSYKLPADLPAGTYTYRVTFTSDYYSKSAEITITVTPISLVGATVTVSNLTYNGNPQEPTVTVKLGDETLSRDNDYTVQVTKQTDAGSEERTAYEVSVMQLLDDEETELI